MSSEKISVLHFSNSLARGGAEEHILTLLRGLDRKCFRLYLVCTPVVAEKLRADVPSDVETIPLALMAPSSVSAAWRLARVLRTRGIGILHSHMFTASMLASPLGRICRIPVIVETPHIREQWRRGWLKGHFLVDRLVARFVDHYIGVSGANARYLVKQKRLPARKIVIIRPGSKLDRFDPAREAPQDLRRRLGFGDVDPVLVVAGRLELQKGHRVLLEALPAIRREFPRVRLVCLSDGSLRSELERRATELGLDESVRFVGYQPDVAVWLALADVSVLPSFYEGLPLAAIESLAAGRPVVASAVDGTPEVVIDSITGFTVPPNDPERLAGAVCRLLRDPDLRQSMGSAGRQLVLKEFSEERLIRETQEFYLWAWETRSQARAGRRGGPIAVAPSRFWPPDASGMPAEDCAHKPQS